MNNVEDVRSVVRSFVWCELISRSRATSANHLQSSIKSNTSLCGSPIPIPSRPEPAGVRVANNTYVINNDSMTFDG